jgi:hypothetical protein
MRGSEKCEPGCQCGRHTRSGNRAPRPTLPTVVDWNDPEAVKAYKRAQAREKYAANPERFKAASRKYAAKKRTEDPDYWRKHRRNSFTWLKYSHGMTEDQFNEMLAVQNGCCYLCDEPLNTAAPRGVHVDHDHDCCASARSCGSCIRGLACHGCNTGIGAFGDDPELIKRVVANLEAANRRLREGQVGPAGAE